MCFICKAVTHKHTFSYFCPTKDYVLCSLLTVANIHVILSRACGQHLVWIMLYDAKTLWHRESPRYEALSYLLLGLIIQSSTATSFFGTHYFLLLTADVLWNSSYVMMMHIIAANYCFPLCECLKSTSPPHLWTTYSIVINRCDPTGEV